MLLRRGQTRTALLVGRWAVKVPTLRHGARQWLLGALANIDEHRISRACGGDRRLARTIWCAPLGLAAVQERVGEALDRDPGDEVDAIPIRDFCGASAAQWHNCSRRDDGSLVCFDYGAPGLLYAP